MTDSVLESTLRRDRTIVLSCLIAMTVLAWAYLIWLVLAMDMGGDISGDMGNVSMSGMAMDTGLKGWSVTDFVAMFVMWSIMMVGMMVPSASPMVLLFARVYRQNDETGEAYKSISAFAGGYLVVWTLFSFFATLAQWGLESMALLSPMMVSTSDFLGGGLLIAAGLYQMTPLKDACLEQCRSPLSYVTSHWRPGAKGAFNMGFRHGAYCVGCCWALMVLLFVGGVMNLVWIAVLAGFVLLEKLWAHGRLASRFAGVGFMIVGIGFIVQAL